MLFLIHGLLFLQDNMQSIIPCICASVATLQSGCWIAQCFGLETDIKLAEEYIENEHVDYNDWLVDFLKERINR